jgi:hypothetical protein
MCCAAGRAAEGLAWIDDGIAGWRALGSTLFLPFWLALKAEALHLADRTPEALEAITKAQTLVERFENRYWWCAELHRLRGVFLAALGREEAQIEAAFRDAVLTAQHQKSISLLKRAEAGLAAYRGR